MCADLVLAIPISCQVTQMPEPGTEVFLGRPGVLTHPAHPQEEKNSTM